MFVHRTEREHDGQERAPLPDQQMRSVAPRYPVDRYLVESSNKFEMVNIIDEDIWNTEPTLKPEDEIILRKLHDTLQSTADDLKLLSGELSKFHKPGVQVKTTPTPLDEEFNEKVHIEEIVNAKFHGYKIIDNSSQPPCMPEQKSRKDKPDNNNFQNLKTTNIDNSANTRTLNKKPVINRNLGITRTKIIEINGDTNGTKTEKLNNGKVVNAPAVAYNEYSYKYIEPKLKTPPSSSKHLQIQQMPSINIRSELKEQKVLQLDILPEVQEVEETGMVRKNVGVVAIQHETKNPVQPPDKKKTNLSHEVPPQQQPHQTCTTRKVSKMSTYDSSGSTNNISSDTQMKLKTQKRILTNIRSSPKTIVRNDRKKSNIKKEAEKRVHLNLDEWRKKLNSVYGSATAKKGKPSQTKSKAKNSSTKSNVQPEKSTTQHNLKNLEYIPYSKLTVGGARASDIEKEISDIPYNRDIPLSPILDRILSSKENSFSKSSSQTHKTKDKLNILTTSDENLLQEVIDVERTVSETLSKNVMKAKSNEKIQKQKSDSDEIQDNESYADDFEDEKSGRSGQSVNQKTNSTHSNDDKNVNYDENTITSVNDDSDNNDNSKVFEPDASLSQTNNQNLTYTKISNLSFKKTVDVFEFVHSVDRQDSATQSNAGRKISLKETQTSPINDNIQPIHNDLWPTLDPKGEVEKLFQKEKEFIKKLIVEEYGDLLVKDIDKPSTSKEIEIRLNVAAAQKNTQTSPAHVKHVMTSPTRTKTRTTSPFKRLTVDHHTSPLVFVVDENDVRLEIENEEDPGISINLSSPRFSLRLPRTSREVLSNLGDSIPRTSRRTASRTRNKKKSNVTITSTSSAEADSSEVSSLGEVRLRRKLDRTRIISDRDSVTSSSVSDYQSGILPLRSEGEMSIGRSKKSTNKQNKSEGEASFGLL